MSTSKLEMSLDDIIKANKIKSKVNRSGGAARKVGNTRSTKKTFGPKSGRGIIKRGNKKVVNTLQQRRNNKVQKPKLNARNGRNNNTAKATTVATKKLVQKLVKRALAQRTVRNAVNVIKPTPIRKRGGVRLVKRTVVLNRVNTKSRVIGRRRAVMNARVAPIRRQIRYNTQAVQYVSAAPVTVQRQFNPRPTKIVRAQPVVIQQAPQRQRNQRQAPVFQLLQVPNRGNSVRSQINALRRQNVFVGAPQVQPHRRPQFRKNVQQVTYVQQRPQQRRRFRPQQQKQRPQQQQVFYEPQNFLQRIPVQQTTRRFIN